MFGISGFRLRCRCKPERHAVTARRSGTPAQHTVCIQESRIRQPAFIYTQRHLRNAIAPKEADSHQHGLTIEQIKSLPEKLEEPVVVFDQPNYTVNGRSFEGKGVAAVLDMYDPDGVPVIAYFFPNGYGTKTNDNGCSNVIASLYGRDNFTSYLARAANEKKILYIDSEKYEQMEKELPRYGGTRFPPALAALSMDIIIPSSYICKMKAEINPKLSDRERNIIPLTAPCTSRSRTAGEIGLHKIGINRATSISDMTTTTAIRSKTIEKEN